MMNERIKKHHLISNSYFIGSILSAILLIYRLSIQPIVAVNNGKGWDGSFYYQMAVNIHAYVELPFRLRIGLPLLVHYIPVDNILYKFKLVNLVFSFLFSVITYVGISKYSKSTLAKIVAWFLICTTALSPIPMSTWYPVNSDVIPNFILVLVLLFVLSEKKSFFFLFVLFAIGSVFRENFPAFASLFLIQTQIVLAPSFISFLKKNININRLFLENITSAVLGSFTGLLLVYFTTGTSPLDGKTNTFLQILSAQSFIDVITAGINVYGTLFIFLISSYFNQQKLQSLIKNRGAFFVIIGLWTLISLGGGSNTERFFYWGLILMVFDKLPSLDKIFLQATPITYIIIIFAAIFQRVLLPISPAGIAGCSIKDYLFGNATYLGHWTQICSDTENFNIIGFYLISSIFLGSIFHFYNLKAAAEKK